MAFKVLESDEHGNVVAKPVKGWAVTTVQSATVLMVFENVDSPSQLETEGRKIQLELTPHQSLLLAAPLTGLANFMLLRVI